MVSVCVGEGLVIECLGMVREQCKLDDDDDVVRLW